LPPPRTDSLSNHATLKQQHAAGVDDEDSKGLTPLHTAAELGSVSQVELLLERGAALNHAGGGRVLTD
jgi:ankyrin repeat protein